MDNGERLQSTVIRPTWHRSLSRAWPWFAFAVGATVLAIMLYIDKHNHVGDWFPLKQHQTSPFIAFLMLGTIGFPFGTWFVIDGMRDLWRSSQSQSWPTVKGHVLKSEVTVTLGKGPRNLPEVSYEYEVDGRRYQGSVIRFAQWKTRFYDNAQTIVDRYPLNGQVEVHYDPDDPVVAVLDTSAGAVYNNLWMGVVYLLFPFLGFFQLFRDIFNG